MHVGFIGLGKMGGRMASKLLQEGHQVVVWNRTQEVTLEFTNTHKTYTDNASLIATTTIKELVEKLPKAKIIWLMLPAGQATEDMLKEVLLYSNPGDIIIDGGNAHYKDTQKRYEALTQKQIEFLGIGVSGGIIAASNGYPIMVGGNKHAYETIIPLLDSLAKPHGGHSYFGEGGAGHFVKMIHNGIEYGIMQSLAEGFDVLHKAPYAFDLLHIAKLWQKGTLVSGFMLDRGVEVLAQDPTLSQLDGVIAESGEARWTIDQAKEENVRVEIIEHSLEYRKRSHTDTEISSSFTAKMVAALRKAFGGHAVYKKTS